MAAYEHLPIFKKLMDLTVFVEQMVSRLSRYYRYSLGSELRSMCHEALGFKSINHEEHEGHEERIQLNFNVERLVDGQKSFVL
jgi:hypothetical protein